VCSLRTLGADGELWQALCAKYYGKGSINEAEADAYIKDVEAKIKSGKLDKKPIPEIHKSAKRLVVKKVSNLKIDGDLSDWQGLKSIPIGRLWRLYERLSPDLARGLGWDGEADLSGEFMVGYDAQTLYIAVAVNDDAVINRDQQKIRPQEKKTAIRRGDTVMLELYGPPDPRVVRTAPVRRRPLQLIPNWQWPLVGTDTWPNVERLSGSTCISRTVKAGYVMEAAIPWNVLDKAPPTSGDSMGFDIYLCDRDKAEGSIEPVWRVFSTVGPTGDGIRPWRFTEYLGAATFE